MSGTALPMIVADELEADWACVRTVEADGNPKHGDQNTDGSPSGRRDFVGLAGHATAWTIREHAAAQQ